MSHEEVIRSNLDWFKDSGVLEDEGREGVYERIWLLDKDNPLVNGNELHQDGIFKYRRVDCTLETALAFSLAHDILGNEESGEIAARLMAFKQRTPYQERRMSHAEFGLNSHGLTFRSALPPNVAANPQLVREYKGDLCFWDKKWVDDNSWAVIIPLALADKSFVDEHMLYNAFLTALALSDKKIILAKYCRGKMQGVPHWGGMRVMALAYVHNITQSCSLEEEVLSSLQPDFERIEEFRKGKIIQPYDLSNCGYSVMQLSTVSSTIKNSDVRSSLEKVAEYLMSRQSDQGHWPGEWWEGSSGEHIADLVYGQNWATLGLQSYSQVTGDKKAKEAVERSLQFLARIQHKSQSPKTNGAWLGAYDTKRRAYGGEDRKEGGPSCVYTGWTNAPITTAFLIDLNKGQNPLLNSKIYDPAMKAKIIRVYEKAKEHYDEHLATAIV